MLTGEPTFLRCRLQPLLGPADKLKGLPRRVPLSDETFDVFLSHNSKDKPAVRRIAEALRERGLRVWLDEWELIPGRRWIPALEHAIQISKTAAVLVGEYGLGPWEQPEYEASLSEFVGRGLPVIPVLLPGAPEKPKLPLFLTGFTWVDLRDGLSKEGLDRLEWGITGKKTNREKKDRGSRILRLHNLPFLPLGDLLKGRDEELQRLIANLQSSAQATTITRPSEAEPLMRRAVEIFEADLGPDHPNTRGVQNNLEVLLAKMRARRARDVKIRRPSGRAKPRPTQKPR